MSAAETKSARNGKLTNMAIVTLQSSAWHGDEPLLLDFPRTWEVLVLGEKNTPALPDHLIRRPALVLPEPKVES